MWRFRTPAIAAIVALAAFGFGSMTAAALGESKKDEAFKKDDAPRIREARPFSAPDAQQYCANIAATAGAARNARQEKQLLEIEQQIGRRLSELEAKRAELQELMDRYEALVKKVDDGLVAIYARMRSGSAAAQLANMEEDVAAALLMRLQPKQSSAILNDMEASRAVLLTKKIAGVSTLAQAGKKP
ncbi:MAG: hypothetical protein F9K41_10050 [Sphingopyxis terrae]|nr:MAG: hypothetical protein F9K41_10050 [Sphingopyxis terrae]